MENQSKNRNLKIVQYIIEQETKDLDYCELSTEQQVEKYGLAQWFYSSSYNSRLTYTGMWYMKRWFRVIKINFTHKNPSVAKTDHLFWLGKSIKTPFYISYNGKYIELFNEEDAIELIMLDGDLDQYSRIHKNGERNE